MNYDSTLLSICIGTFNRYPCLEMTINNIINELDEIPFEIIVVDGGSTDGTIKYIEEMELSKKYIRLIQHGGLLGVPKVFNDALKIALGKYIYCLPDHSLIDGKTFINSMILMENENDIAGVIQKIMITSRNYAYLSYHKKFPNLILCEQIIWRRNDINEADTSYKKHFWLMDIMLGCMIAGKVIAHTRHSSNIHIMTDHNDAMHRSAKNYGRGDKIYFNQKWEKLNQVIKAEMLMGKKIRIKVFKKIIYYFLQITNSNYFNILNNRISQNDMINIELSRCLKYGKKDDSTINFKEILVRKYNISTLDGIADWLFEKSSAFVKKDNSNVKNFYLFQQLPDSVVQKYNGT